jgi:hypothetical protein
VPLDIKKVGDEYRVLAGAVSLRFRSLTPHHDGPTAIVECLDLTIGGRPHVDRLSLLSSRTRSSLSKTLAARWPDHGWSDILDDACHAVYDAMGKGDPAVDLAPEEPKPDDCLVEGLIPLDQITVLYADGGSLKSYFALALALAAIRNEPVAPAARWCVRQCLRVLYLDWETDQRTHARRLWRLSKGLGITPPEGISYLRMTGRPLHATIQSVTSEVTRLGADLLVIDSLGMACGDEPETAQANLRTLGALATLPGTKLVLAHVNAQTAIAPNGPGRPYGSVFIRNTARSAIEARGEPDGDSGQLVTYHHRKANDGPLLPPSAIRYHFASDGSVSLTSAEPDLQHAGTGERVYAILRPRTLGKYADSNGNGLSVRTISDRLDLTDSATRAALHRLEKRSLAESDEAGGHGRGDKTLWFRADAKRSDKVPF